MVKIDASVKNTFVHGELDNSSCVKLGIKPRRRASSTTAAEIEKYNAYAFQAPGLQEFPLLPHDEDDYSSMHAYPGPSPLDMDVDGTLDRRVVETDVDEYWGLLSPKLNDAATPDVVDVGDGIVDTVSEEIEDISASALACHGCEAQLPNDDYLQVGLSKAPMSPHESARSQCSTSQMSPHEEQRDSYSESHSRNTLARASSTAKREETQDEEERTTVMLMNLPRRYTSSRLMRTIDSEGFAGMYDFIYVPMAAARTCKGYAFVNCVSPSIAQRFVSAFKGFSRWYTASENVCQVVWAKHHQGLLANIDHYRNSTVMGASVPNDYKPRIIMNGREMPFPPPNRKRSV